MNIQTCGVMSTQCQAQSGLDNKQEKLMQANCLDQQTAGKLQQVIAVLKRWKENHHTRQQLRHMDEHLLKDIGISRADMIEEASKHFWQD